MDYPIAVMFIDTTKRLIKRASRSKHSAVKGYIQPRTYQWCVTPAKEGYFKLFCRDEYVDARWMKHI